MLVRKLKKFEEPQTNTFIVSNKNVRGRGVTRDPPPAGMLTLLHNNKEKINSSFLHLFAEFSMNLESLKNRGLKGLFTYLGNFMAHLNYLKKLN